jgi:TonB family protein
VTNIRPRHQTSYQFKDFGVLDAGKQSAASTMTSIVVNLALIGLALLLGTMAKRTLDEQKRVAMLTMPVVIKPIEPVVPKVIPRPLPMPVVKVEPPKIKLPEIKPIEVPKPAEVKMTQPLPVLAPAAPKKVVAPPAPVAVSLARPMAASVVNNSQHPSPVALGSATNPIAPSNQPAVSQINLGQKGLAGMPSSNTGGGPAATAVHLGFAMNTPKVLWKPKPAYTAEATALHINGVVQVRIRVSATGSVTVLAVTHPLGHGLDQSAERAAESMRFQPAVDANGHPVDWEGNVTVTFQTESNG